MKIYDECRQVGVTKSYFPLLIMALLASTQGLLSDTQTIRDHEQLAYSSSSKIRIEYVQRFGDVDSEDEDGFLYLPTDIAKDSKGLIYIADSGNSRIQKYSSNGRLLKSIGREGQGPGEFLQISAIDIDSEDHLYISDRKNRRIQILTNEGIYIGGHNKRSAFDFFRLYSNKNFAVPSGGRDPMGVPLVPKIEASQTLISVLDNRLNVIQEVGQIQRYGTNELDNKSNCTAYCLDSKDNLFITFIYQNRIERYDRNGKLIFQSSRPLEYDLDYQWIKERDGIKYPRPVLDILKVSCGIGVDHKHRIWVATYTKLRADLFHNKYDPKKKGNMIVFEVFNDEGVLLTRIPFAQRFLFMRVIADRLFLIDPVVNMSVYEYRILE